MIASSVVSNFSSHFTSLEGFIIPVEGGVLLCDVILWSPSEPVTVLKGNTDKHDTVPCLISVCFWTSGDLSREDDFQVAVPIVKCESCWFIEE